jgi:hypothetical protein
MYLRAELNSQVPITQSAYRRIEYKTTKTKTNSRTKEANK